MHTCAQPGALRPLSTASKHGSAHALADQDDLSQAAAAFDAFFKHKVRLCVYKRLANLYPIYPRKRLANKQLIDEIRTSSRSCQN